MAESGRSLSLRSYLINTRFQMKYTLMVILISAVIFCIFGYKLYHIELEKTAILQIKSFDVRNLVRAQDRTVLYYLAGFFCLQIVSLLGLGIFITHRIAGPVFRMRRYLDEIANTGKIPTLDRIRSKDEFQEFFDALTRMIDRFQKKNDEQKAKLLELQNGIKEAKRDARQLDRCEHLSEKLLEIL